MWPDPQSLHEKCPYTELFWSVFSSGKIRARITPNNDTHYVVSFLWICSHLLEKLLMENFISCAVSNPKSPDGCLAFYLFFLLTTRLIWVKLWRKVIKKISKSSLIPQTHGMVQKSMRRHTTSYDVASTFKQRRVSIGKTRSLQYYSDKAVSSQNFIQDIFLCYEKVIWCTFPRIYAYIMGRKQKN